MAPTLNTRVRMASSAKLWHAGSINQSKRRVYAQGARETIWGSSSDSDRQGPAPVTMAGQKRARRSTQRTDSGASPNHGPHRSLKAAYGARVAITLGISGLRSRDETTPGTTPILELSTPTSA